MSTAAIVLHEITHTIQRHTYIKKRWQRWIIMTVKNTKLKSFLHLQYILCMRISIIYVATIYRMERVKDKFCYSYKHRFSVTESQQSFSLDTQTDWVPSSYVVWAWLPYVRILHLVADMLIWIGMINIQRSSYPPRHSRDPRWDTTLAQATGMGQDTI